MVYVAAAAACVCEPNAIAVSGGCQPCAADEIVAGAACACAPGKTKSADNRCVTVAGLGDACDTATAPCTDATYSYCAAGDAGTAGTCTNRCAGDSDCDSVYTCATWESAPYCRTFTGAGASCASDADCVDDAKWCDIYKTHKCVVQGCSLTQRDCPRDTQCCDLSGYGFGTLCVEACQ